MKTMFIKKIIALCSLLILFSTAYAQQFTLQNAAGNPGQTVTVSLDITQAIPNVGAITIFLQFNNAVISYTNSYSIVMPQAAGTLVNLQPDPSKIGMIWVAPGANGINFPTGTMLTLNFTVLSCNNSAIKLHPGFGNSRLDNW